MWDANPGGLPEDCLTAEISETGKTASSGMMKRASLRQGMPKRGK